MERRDKQNAQLEEDIARLRDKADKLLKTIDELQSSESSVQLSARRAERELRQERERSLGLEREIEGWRMRSDKGSIAGSVAGSVIGYGSMRRAGTQSTFRSAHVADATPEEEEGSPDIPKRKSSIGRTRQPSMTKGFL